MSSPASKNETTSGSSSDSSSSSESPSSSKKKSRKRLHGHGSNGCGLIWKRERTGTNACLLPFCQSKCIQCYDFYSKTSPRVLDYMKCDCSWPLTNYMCDYCRWTYGLADYNPFYMAHSGGEHEYACNAFTCNRCNKCLDNCDCNDRLVCLKCNFNADLKLFCPTICHYCNSCRDC